MENGFYWYWNVDEWTVVDVTMDPKIYRPGYVYFIGDEIHYLLEKEIKLENFGERIEPPPPRK